MNYSCSYFNPDLKKAVYFILSMRALPGGAPPRPPPVASR